MIFTGIICILLRKSRFLHIYHLILCKMRILQQSLWVVSGDLFPVSKV
jgi:hypothetical protein